MATITVNGTTFTVDSGGVLLSSSSHPTLGLIEAHFRCTQAIPEGASVAQAGSITTTNGTVAPGQSQSRRKDRGDARGK